MEYFCRILNGKYYDFRKELSCFDNDITFDKSETLYKVKLAKSSILSAKLVGYERFSDNKIVCIANDLDCLKRFIDLDYENGRIVYFDIVNVEECFLCS